MSYVRIMPSGMEDEGESSDDLFDSVQKTYKNLKITVVPDITISSGLNDENFDATLPSETKKWFESYRERLGVYKRSSTMVEALRSLYLNSENPLLLALKLFANCPGCSNAKNKLLPSMIFEILSDVRDEKPGIITKCTDNMKMVAFNFVKTQGLPKLYKAVANAFSLKEDKHLFEEKIRILISQHNYKDASYWAMILDLTDKFGVFDLIFPLILQDKIFIAEEYLDIEVSLQRHTVELLDSLLDKSSTVFTKCSEYIDKYKYPDIKMEKLHSKPLTKLIVRLGKKYNLPMEATPNVKISKSYGYLQYLIHKKYVDKSLNNDSWRELVYDALPYLSGSKDMQLELISLISFNNDMIEAVYWSKHFNLEFDELPSLLKDFISSDSKNKKLNDGLQNNFIKQESWDYIEIERDQYSSSGVGGADGIGRKHHNLKQKDEYHQLKLDLNRIIYVERASEFFSMLNELKNEPLIAFDSEWKPSFQYKMVISLIQLAKFDKIFLIDSQSIEITDELWSELGKQVFNNMEMVKIGFSLNQDLTMFQKAIPAMNVSTQIQSCYIDLQDLWKKLLNLPGFQFPYKNSTSNETLSQLAEICLGKKLDKSNQFSNWSNRPLRRDQIHYAALDAYCLLEIYEVITKQLNQMGVGVDLVFNRLNVDLKTKSQKIRKKQKLRHKRLQNYDDIPDCFNAQPVRPSEVKFACDSMLGGLAKSLRKLGIDCLIIQPEEREYCAEISLRECRYLLTKGYRYIKFSQYFPRGYCYNVRSDYVIDQTLEVLNYYKVIITEEDIFSRCQICNCNEFIIATSKHVADMKNNKNSKSTEMKDEQNINPPQRNCVIRKITSKLLNNKMTSKGVLIKLTNVTEGILGTVDQFYICEECGKCYWDGSHWERMVNGRYKDIIIKN